MSLVTLEIVRCAVCGAKSKHPSLISTNNFGSSDLDLRPPEMERSTMEYWVQKCPSCGYVADCLDKVPKIHSPFLKKDEYRMCLGLNFKSDLAEIFFQQYLIQIAEKNTKNAFEAILHAAWACDDVEDKEKAVICRKYALEELDKLIQEADDETLIIQKADLLRRSGLFETVIEEYEDSVYSADLLTRIASFQVRKSYAEDSSCYTVADAMEENLPIPSIIERAMENLRGIAEFFKPKDDNREG